jgi:large subunit ribosomal protein L24
MNTSNTQSPKLTIKKNDQVQVISGRDKGKIGKVTLVDSKKMKITVEKVNLVKRHTKPTQGNPQGGIVEKEIPLHYSKVLLFCTKCNKGVRHGFQTHAHEKSAKGAKAAAGKSAPNKVRICKKCKTTLDAA